jgi:hypothetical protein
LLTVFKLTSQRLAAVRWQGWGCVSRLRSNTVVQRLHDLALYVVNGVGEIVHFSSNTGRYLQPAVGAPTANLFEMARQGWALELRAALRRCAETGRSVEQSRAVVAADGDRTLLVKLIIEPLPSP